MKTIPKTSKVRIKFYRGITIPDLIIGLICMLFITLTITSNFDFKWSLLLIELCIFTPMFLNLNGDRLYKYIGYFINYLISKKIFSKCSEEDAEDIQSIYPYRDINDKKIYSVDSTTAVIEISPVDFNILSPDRQEFYINHVLSRALNIINCGDSINIVKLEHPLILDNYLNEELSRVFDIKMARENGTISEKEEIARINSCEDRIALIDAINSRDDIYYSKYYMCISSKDINNIESMISRIEVILNSNGIRTHRLSDEELSLFIRYSIDSSFDEREVRGTNVHTPNAVEFKLASTIQDNKSLSHFVINNYPLRVWNAWANGLFDMENTKVVMKLLPIEKAKAIRRLDNAISEVLSQEQKSKASNQIEVQTHLESLQELLESVQNDNEVLFDTTITITVYDELGSNENKKKVKARLREMNFGFTDMIGRQQEAYISSHVSPTNITNISRGIQTSIIASSFPFISNAIMDEKGILIGENRLPVFIDFFKRNEDYVNSNMMIIGKSGSGKSFATKTIMNGLANNNTKLYVLDPENEYSILAKNLGGKVIDVSNGNHGRINPFQILPSNEEEDSNDYFLHLQFLEQFYRTILKGIDPNSFELLNKLTQELYETMKIDSTTNIWSLKNEDYPTFDDLYDFVCKKLESEEDNNNISYMKTILNYISKFKTGGRNSNLWNGYSSLEANEHFISFNFQNLLANKNNEIANAQMLLVLRWLEHQIILNRDYNNRFNDNRKIVVAIDEAHLFIDSKYPVALDFIHQLAKRIRKYDGMLMIITQSINDFVGTPDIAKKSMAIIDVCQYSLIFNLNANDMNNLCDLYHNAGQINDYEKELIVHNPRGRAFLIASPKRRTCFDVIATEYTTQLFEKDGN